MGLETATYLADLVTTNPPGTDSRSQGDDHLRLLKTVLQTSFPKDLRGVSSPGLGQPLRYDGTSFKNTPALCTHVARAANYTIPSSGGVAVTFDTETEDGFGIFVIGSPTIITLTAATLSLRHAVELQVANQDATEVVIRAWIQRNSDSAKVTPVHSFVIPPGVLQHRVLVSFPTRPSRADGAITLAAANTLSLFLECDTQLTDPVASEIDWYVEYN